ncbi:MAG: hypothetical protein ACREUG_06345, partial [Steroidobacteraceae bacterium]
MSARGQIGIVAHGPRLDLQGEWKRFRWPLAGKVPAVTSTSGQYVLHGVRPYDVRGSGELAIRGIEPIGFELEGTLDEHALRMRRAALRAFGGRARVTGEMAWSPRTAWTATGTAIDIDPVSLRHDLPGHLTFDFRASGSRLGKGADFSVAVRQLSGELRHLRARGDGAVSRHGSVWQLAGVHAQLGRTTLSLDGTMDDRVDLSFRLAADDLRLLDPEMTGRLDAHGTLRGPRREPAVDLVATGSRLHFRGFSLATLDARVDFDPRRGESQAAVHAHGFAFGPRKLGELDFALDGPATEQRATLTIAGGGYRAEAHALGTLMGGAWRGMLTTLTVGGDETHLALAAPTALSVMNEAFHLDRMCLTGKPARFCADGDWSPHEWNVFVLANGLPLQLLTAGITPDVQY